MPSEHLILKNVLRHENAFIMLSLKSQISNTMQTMILSKRKEFFSVCFSYIYQYSSELLYFQYAYINICATIHTNINNL